MNIAFFSAKQYDKESFEPISKAMNINITYFEEKLTHETALFAKGYEAICSFVNDNLNADTINVLKNIGIKAVLLRCAGYDSVDLEKAREVNIPVFRVPAYSPPSVAEHAVALLLTINRNICVASSRTKNFNFDINGLIGKTLRGQTAGIVGTGKIGKTTVQILKGFGMDIIAYDKYPDKEANIRYVTIDELFSKSDVISLHTPLNSETYHMINSNSISKMKDSVIIVNTARGELVCTKDLIKALRNDKIGGAGLDVYEHEREYFYEDKSQESGKCTLLKELLSFDKVVITGHQAFFTEEAMKAIAETTLNNLKNYLGKGELTNEVNLFLDTINSK